MLIQAINLSKKYPSGDGETHALKEVGLSIERGEFVAVVGTSGSGKSTLLNLLGGLDKPTSGEIYVNGHCLNTMKPDELTLFRRRSIGFVFQSYNLIPVLNVYENIVLPAQLDGVEPDKGYLEALIATLGLEKKLFSLPSRLSGGQQQRVAIARALATRPSIVLADEPTGNLDSKTGLEVLLLMKTLNERYAQTLVMITHNDELASLASRRIHIEDGRILSDTGADL